MPDFQMRDARDSDQATIRDVTIGAYQEFAAFFEEGWNDYRASILATLADVKPAEQIVAERDGVVVGTALLFPPGTAFHSDEAADPATAAAAPAGPEIRLLAVAPAARGQGIGKALVLECLRRARLAGCKVLTLHTTDLMQVAMQMYERMGFIRAPELDFFPVPDFTVKGYRISLED